MSRRRRVAAALAVVAVAAAGGGWLATRSAPSTRTTPSPSTSPTSSGGVLRLLSENRYPSLDPSALVLPQARNLGRLLYRTLTTYDDDGRSLVPDLASAPGTASADHRTWTYALRGGQRYADGSVVVASDVVRGVRLSLARGALPAGLVRSVAAPDARTVVVRFSQPFVDADALLALTAAAPVPARGVRASGPYEVSTRTATSFRLVRNPHWSGPAPGPDEVDGELGLDGATIDQRLAAGAGGDAAAVTDKPALDVVPASRKHVVSGLDGSVLFAAMDMHRGPFSDLLVRQALEVAVPLDRVRAAAGSGTGEPATDLLPPPVPGHQDLDLYGWKARKDGGDPVRAKQLLADAGHPAGVTVTAAVPRSAAAVGEALRAGLAPAGFRVVVSAVPDAAYYATVGVAARQADLVLYAWSPDWLTGSAVIPPLFTCAALTATANHNLAQHCDPGFDRQVHIALGTPDDDAREAMWRALDRRLVEEALVVPRSFGVATALVGPAVKDAQPAVCFGGMVDLLRVRLGG